MLRLIEVDSQPAWTWVATGMVPASAGSIIVDASQIGVGIIEPTTAHYFYGPIQIRLNFAPPYTQQMAELIMAIAAVNGNPGIPFLIVNSETIYQWQI